MKKIFNECRMVGRKKSLILNATFEITANIASNSCTQELCEPAQTYNYTIYSKKGQLIVVPVTYTDWRLIFQEGESKILSFKSIF
jgi:hypothetical protein